MNYRQFVDQIFTWHTNDFILVPGKLWLKRGGEKVEINNRFVLLIGIFLCCILVLVSCGNIVRETTATLEITDTPTPTITLSLIPTLTATPLPSFTPTPTFSLQGRITFIYSEGFSYIAYLDSNYEIILLALEDFDYARDYAFSPDGKYLVFEKRINGISELYLLDLETEEEIQLTILELSGITKGYWSPNSKEIAFHGNDEEIYIISAENGEGHQVTYNRAIRGNIRWSPDGKQIAYVASDGDLEIFIISSDGTGMVQLTNNRIRDLYPCWSPDGRYIAYVTSDDVNKSLVISSEDSIIQEILFNGIITIQDPMWMGD